MQSAALLIMVKTGLRLFPERVLGYFLKPTAGQPPFSQNGGGAYQQLVKRAVSRASRHLIGSYSCLPQAIVTVILLRRANEPALLRLGVRKGSDQELVAHAWVECAGKIVIGGPEPEILRYQPFLNLKETRL